MKIDNDLIAARAAATLRPKEDAHPMRALLFLIGALLAAAAHAQDAWPSRPLHMVVGYPPGALTDLLARAVADRLAPALKQPVVIDNKPGAGTLLAADQVKNAPADGYTLMMVTSTTLGISPAAPA